ncbi:stage III sporulation protein AG [Dethiothermospora halolimnae]|uniref:stage III sporulation protein AG n=1 Tax=Dethiothermospora halolimnae TaxID=3114390 RepID=UPI003CCC2153
MNLEEIRKFFQKNNSKKLLTNLTVLLIIGIILLLMASILGNKDNKSKDNTIKTNNKKVKSELLIDDYASNIEKKLQNIVSKIQGVGEISVMVTLEDTAERIPAVDVTESNEKTNEKDSQGGTREMIRNDRTKNVVTTNSSNGEGLIVIKEVKPQVKGVIVVAEGAEDIKIKEKIYRAVKTVLSISGNRVEVFSSN